MFPWLFNVYMSAVMKFVKMELGRFLGEIREWRLSGPSCADDLVLCGESEEDLKVMVGLFLGKRIGSAVE